MLNHTELDHIQMNPAQFNEAQDFKNTLEKLGRFNKKYAIPHINKIIFDDAPIFLYSFKRFSLKICRLAWVDNGLFKFKVVYQEQNGIKRIKKIIKIYNGQVIK